jgi:hypothetical protein
MMLVRIKAGYNGHVAIYDFSQVATGENGVRHVPQVGLEKAGKPVKFYPFLCPLHILLASMEHKKVKVPEGFS